MERRSAVAVPGVCAAETAFSKRRTEGFARVNHAIAGQHPQICGSKNHSIYAKCG